MKHAEKRSVKGHIRHVKGKATVVKPTVAVRYVETKGDKEKNVSAIKWDKVVHTYKQSDFGLRSGEKDTPIRAVSYTVNIPGRDPITVMHIGGGKSLESPNIQEEAESVVHTNLSADANLQFIYFHRESNTSSVEVEKHIEERLGELAEKWSKTQSAKKKDVGRAIVGEPGRGIMSRHIENFEVPFEVEGAERKPGMATDDNRKYFDINTRLTLTPDESFLLHEEYAPLIKQLAANGRNQAMAMLAAQGIRLGEADRRFMYSLCEGACFIGLHDAAARYSPRHKSEKRRLIDVVESRAWAHMMMAINEELPRWDAKPLSAHRAQKKWAFTYAEGGKEAPDEIDDDANDIEIMREAVFSTGFVSPDEERAAREYLGVLVDFQDSLQHTIQREVAVEYAEKKAEAKNKTGRGGTSIAALDDAEKTKVKRLGAAIKAMFDKGEIDRETKTELKLQTSDVMWARAIVQSELEKNPLAKDALLFRAKLARRRRQYANTVIDYTVMGEPKKYDLGEMLTEVELTGKPVGQTTVTTTQLGPSARNVAGLAMERPLEDLHVTRSLVFDLHKVHVKTYTKNIEGKSVVVQAHEDTRVKRAKYVGKTRTGAKDMWHYKYQDEHGEFEHYHPPMDHAHASIYNRDKMRAERHAKKHGVEVPDTLRHDPQGLFNHVEDERGKRKDAAKKEKQKREAGKAEKKKKTISPEETPNYFAGDGEKLNRPYPSDDERKQRGIGEIQFNENMGRDFYCRWQNPKNGKWEYCYRDSVREAKQADKFKKIRDMGKKIHTVRKAMVKDFDKPDSDDAKMVAAVGLIIDHCYIRVGSETMEAKREAGRKEHFGLLTLQKRHMKFDRVNGKPAFRLEYVGKSGKEQRQVITDQRMVDYLYGLWKAAKDDTDTVFKLPGGREGNVYDMVDRHFEQRYGYKPKDFRTYHGSRLAEEALKKVKPGQVQGEADIDKAVNAAIEGASRHLGNTPEVCREHYVDPFVIATFTGAMKQRLAGGVSKADVNADLQGSGDKKKTRDNVYYMPLDAGYHPGEQEFIDKYERADETDQSEKTEDDEMEKRLVIDLSKSHVKAHTRRTASGKIAHVKEHQDKRTKKLPQVGDAIHSGLESNGYHHIGDGVYEKKWDDWQTPVSAKIKLGSSDIGGGSVQYQITTQYGEGKWHNIYQGVGMAIQQVMVDIRGMFHHGTFDKQDKWTSGDVKVANVLKLNEGEYPPKYKKPRCDGSGIIRDINGSGVDVAYWFNRKNGAKYYSFNPGETPFTRNLQESKREANRGPGFVVVQKKTKEEQKAEDAARSESYLRMLASMSDKEYNKEFNALKDELKTIPKDDDEYEKLKKRLLEITKEREEALRLYGKRK